MRSGLVVVGIVGLTLASCATIPTPQDANDAVLMLRKYDAWAWAVGIALIWADLVLPVPQTVVIAALGIIYGTVLGGLLGSVGLITGGLFGYVLMLTSARRMVKRFVGPQSLNRMESLFERGGAWAIVLTRSLPYSIPEAMVFLAGLAGMPMGKFTAAVIVGSVPTAFAFAAIGAGWADQPILALVVSYVLPILLLPIALFLMRWVLHSDPCEPLLTVVARQSALLVTLRMLTREEVWHLSILANAGSGPEGTASPAGDQLQPRTRMDGAHQQVHRDHSAERRYLRGRAEHFRRATAQDTGQQRHDGESRRRREGQPVGCPKRGGVPAGRSLSDDLRRKGLAHGFVLACWFRNAASPASDTSTHFLSGAASAT